MNMIECQEQKIWNEFVKEHSQPPSFLQSWEWGEFKKKIGCRIFRIGIQKSAHELWACATLVKQRLPLARQGYWYIPRGPIIHPESPYSKDEFIKTLLAFVLQKNNRPVFLRICPAWSLKNDTTLWSLFGFEEPRIVTRQQEPETTLITSLVDDQSLLMNMHTKTRYNIRLAERKLVSTRVVSDNVGFEHFMQLLRETAKRERIALYDTYYYTTLRNVTRTAAQTPSPVNHFNVTSMIMVAYESNIPLAAGMWVGFGNTLTYVYGGSTRKHHAVMAPYKLHWDALRWARNNGYAFYDWWGIQGKRSVFHLSGVSRFKQGFGGAELEFAPTQDFIYDATTMKYLKFLKKIKEVF